MQLFDRTSGKGNSVSDTTVPARRDARAATWRHRGGRVVRLSPAWLGAACVIQLSQNSDGLHFSWPRTASLVNKLYIYFSNPPKKAS